VPIGGCHVFGVMSAAFAALVEVSFLSLGEY
jgi:hypothetical protein